MMEGTSSFIVLRLNFGLNQSKMECLCAISAMFATALNPRIYFKAHTKKIWMIWFRKVVKEKHMAKDRALQSSATTTSWRCGRCMMLDLVYANLRECMMWATAQSDLS